MSLQIKKSNHKIERLEVEGRELEYTVRKSKRARQLLLHVDVNGAIELVLPRWTSYKDGAKFVRSQQKWVAEQLEKQALRARSIPVRKIEDGAQLPCFGADYTLHLVRQGKRSSILEDEEEKIIHVQVPKDKDVRPVIERWYKQKAKEFFTEKTRELAHELDGKKVTVKINSAKSQWGSCQKHRRIITFSWRLALGYPEAARYVIAHEVAHLRYGGHGKRFWALVAKLYPDYYQHSQYLRQFGYTLVL